MRSRNVLRLTAAWLVVAAGTATARGQEAHGGEPLVVQTKQRQQGRVQIDRFKCADWPELIEPASSLLPIYVHFPLVAGTNTLDNTDWERVERLLGETGTPYVNVHLLADGKGPEAELSPEQRHAMIEGMIAKGSFPATFHKV